MFMERLMATHCRYAPDRDKKFPQHDDEERRRLVGFARGKPARRWGSVGVSKKKR
jgi:hypothetical protein